SIAPFTRTCIPTSRLASVSKTERYWLQSMNSGPTSAATRATMIAIASPSSVVCNGALRYKVFERRWPAQRKRRPHENLKYQQSGTAAAISLAESARFDDFAASILLVLTHASNRTAVDRPIGPAACSRHITSPTLTANLCLRGV